MRSRFVTRYCWRAPLHRNVCGGKPRDALLAEEAAVALPSLSQGTFHDPHPVHAHSVATTVPEEPQQKRRLAPSLQNLHTRPSPTQRNAKVLESDVMLLQDERVGHSSCEGERPKAKKE